MSQLSNEPTPPKSRGWLDRATFMRVDAGLALLLFAASMALYVRTVAPGLLDGDEGEFQVNIFKLGVSHTGYPFFFMLGKLWTLLVPVGTVATRANLFSAFWGALSVAAVFVIIQFLTRNRWAALISALLLAASRVEWSQAVIPRPYTLNSLFVVVVTLLFFLWRAGKVDLTVPVFAFGLSLTNHRTIMWMGPAIAVLVLWHERTALFRPRRLLSLIIAFCLPLFLYAYVFWRGESDVGVEFHWKDFNDEILGGYVRASWRFGPVGWLISRITDLYLPMLVEQFTWPGLVAGLLGAGALALDRAPRGWPRNLPPREAFLFILLANLANTAFCVIFWVIDIDKFFLPSFITFLFFTGIGIAVIWDWLTTRPARWATRLALALLFAGVTVFLVVHNLPLNDESSRTDVAAAWAENLSQPLEPKAVIAGPWESITPLEYAMYVDNRRRDLERWKLIVNNYQLGEVPYGSRQQDIEKAVRAGRPVYMTVYPGDTETLGALVHEFLLTRVGELWRVVDAPPSNKAMLEQVKTSSPQAVFSGGDDLSLELLDSAVARYAAPGAEGEAISMGTGDTGKDLHAGDFAVVTLYWRLRQSTRERLSVSLRLLDAQNHLIAQRDSVPSSGRRPTIGWATNEVVQDDAGLIIPPDAPPGTYQLQLVVYNSATGEDLQGPEGTLYPLGHLSIRPAEWAPSPDILTIPHRIDASLASLRLLGYGMDNTSPKGGDTVELSLWWQSAGSAREADTITLSLLDASGRTAKVYTGPPIANYPVSAWAQTAILRGRYALAIPLDFAGSVRVRIESGGGSVELPPLEVQPSGRTFVVPSIQNPQAATFGDSIRLLGYALDKTSDQPGGTLRVTLYWQALNPTASSYVVFAHLLDPNGILRGQKDTVPRGGELPTDHWLPGEVIADSYDITLASDAPRGSYLIEVGMYLPNTGARLAVLDANGTRLQEDRVILNTKIEVK